MPENHQTPELELIPDAIVDRRRRRTSQLIWLIPVLAALIGLSLAIKSYMDRGPVITIIFKSGEGIEAAKTKIKYKDVQIGEVKSVTISKDRSHVVVTAEFKKDAEGLLVEDTLFWVVKPRISGGTVSGLGTLMGGSYIGMDVGKSKQSKYDFTGLEDPPVVTMDEPGAQFKLHAADIGSLNIKSPVFFRRMQVGEVISYELDKDGKGVTLKVFIRTPFDRFVKAGTLFWHASGIDFTMDASGLKVNSESMVSLLLGGIAFQTPEDSVDIRPAPANSTFTLFTTKEEALKRIDSIVETYLLVFKESVRGLSIGAPVDLRGVTVGEVSRISVELDTRNKRFVMPVEVKFYPERLRAHSRSISKISPRQSSKQLVNALVSNGMRAQIRSGNLLTGQLYITLDFFPKASPASVDWAQNPPEFPTTPGNMEQFQTMLMQIVQKIEKLPLEELSGDTRKTLQSLETTLKNADRLLKNVDAVVVPETRLMLEDARKTLNEANKALAGAKQTLSVDAPLQRDLRETLREVSRAAQSLRVLGDYLEQHPEALISGKKEEKR
ncbi:MAG: MCE family protein [Desulfuromonadales bacterium]|nr:MCE family protein [Desulfuromonadales bacterium]